MLGVFPAVMLAVCPVMDSPFYTAKCSVLFAFGASACLLLRKALPAHQATHPAETGRARDSVLLFCFGAWILATCIATTYAHAWGTAWRPLAVYGAAIGVATAIIRLQIERHTLLFWMAASSVVLACVVLAGWVGYDLPRLLTGTAAPGRMRASATLGNPLFVASFLSSAMWSACAFPGLRTVWRVGLLLLILLALAATGERTAIVGVLAGAIWWQTSEQRKPRHSKLYAALTLLAAAGLFVATHALNPRSVIAAANGRIFLWKTSLHHVHLFGDGAGSFSSRYAENLRELAPGIPASNFVYVAFESQAHNLFVQQIVEAGPFGCAALLVFLAVWFSSAWKDRHQIEVRASLAGTAAFLATGCFDNPLSRPEGALLLACWLAVPYMRGEEHPSPAPSFSRQRSYGWRHHLLPVCSIALWLAAAANTICSYAIYSGERAEQLVQWSEAEHWLRVALRIDPAAQDAHFDLVRVLCESGEYDACWTESENALRWVDEAELHLLRVRVLQALGRDQTAQQELTAARQQFPWSRELRMEQVASTSTHPSAY